ncbi:beta-galactosidase small subunit [Anaerosporobacter sp.]|uniref:beta-galactosidase small subunit n=1 Tax=Anaerosporobacter sp. TaxID=1872529 RepID=UPI00286F8EB8|nr:beta-galactosidase small subunit [Anaerosporobacter sp.]
MDYTNKLQIIYGDVTIGIKGADFHYIFSYQTGGLDSLVIGGKEWLYRTPRPTFWRATTDNDRGNRFSIKSGMWLGADMFLPCTAASVEVDGAGIELPIAPVNNQYTGNETADKIKITFTYNTITTPSTEVEVAYEVSGDGKIQVHVHYHGKEGLPELPVFGMRFVMPTKAVSYTYEGLSDETYPDRMLGGEKGIYTIEGLPVTKYIVPQDCNVHMNTDWLEVCRDTTKNNADKSREEFKLRFESLDKQFAFSCIPYTAEELENATHHEELPLPRRTVVSILGAVRGVGGIDSWGADVELPHRINAEKDITFSFAIMKGLD